MHGVPDSRVTDVQDIAVFELGVRAGEGGRERSTSEGPDTRTIVVKHGCILAHSHATTVRFRKPLLSAHQSLLSIRSTHEKPRQ